MYYERGMDFDTAIAVLRVRMWEMGHSFAEIDSMSLEDFGNVIGYWSESQRAKSRLQKQFSRRK